MRTITTNQSRMRRPTMVEHRTEPRIVLQMSGEPGNTKLKPTVFMPSLLLRMPLKEAV